MSGQWVRVSPSMKCPVCKKNDWCCLHVLGKKVLCSRVRGVVRTRAGWIHKLYDNGLLSSKKIIRRRSNRAINWATLNQLYIQQGVKRLSDLSRKLSLSVAVLQKFLVGWDGEAYTIPSRNGFREMNGIMRRWPDGSKKWMTRSRNGLFIPRMKSIEGNLFVNEGWTDAGALVELGFRAIARANCNTGLEYIKDFIADNRNIAQVVVVGDNDVDNVHGDVGKQGAERLARELYGSKVQIGVLEIPTQFNDMRNWYVNGRADRQSIVTKVRKI